jgi:hypothetical protein
MTNRLRPLLDAALIAALSSLAGCAGGQTGHEGENANCKETARKLGLNEASPLGFSADEVLGFAEGAHVTSFDWQPSPDVPYGPESGVSELTLAVTSLGVQRFVTRELDGTSMSEELGCCSDSLQLNVRIDLRTSSGALDETFDTVLEARHAGSASLSVRLGPVLRGKLAFDQQSLGTAKLEGLQLDARFAEGDFSGALHARFEETSLSDDPEGVTSLRIEQLAEWGQSAGSSSFCTE